MSLFWLVFEKKGSNPRRFGPFSFFGRLFFASKSIEKSRPAVCLSNFSNVKKAFFWPLAVAVFFQYDWQIFKSYEGRFVVLAPGKMVEKAETRATKIGSIDQRTWFFHDPSDSAELVFCLVQTIDYPDGAMHSDSTELLKDFWAETIDAARLAVGGKVDYETDEAFEKWPAKLWRIRYNGGRATIKTRAILVEKRLFLIQTVAKTEKSLSSGSEKFLSSFRLLD